MTITDEKDTGASTVTLAFLVGALTGAAVALLFAPASGEETREYLGQRAREGRARAREAVEQGRGVSEQPRENLGGAVEPGQEPFQQTPAEAGRQA